MARKRYLLDNQQVEAGDRFDALSQLFNPSTFHRMDVLGLSRGWRVWEVGAGGASVPSWIATRTSDYVLATDIDTSWLDAENTAYEARRHDIGTEPAPDGPFDLVHARLVLVHVPERTDALATMISALRPGGWLFLEEADPGLQPLVCPAEVGPQQHLANKLKLAFRSLMSEGGADLSFGRTLPRLLRSAGLIEVQSDAYFPMGGPACNELERATVLQVRDRLISAGLATFDEIEQHLANVASGRLDLATSPMVSAWARKPE
ncbi:MAG: class I SAM-dependent methyltransferase [Acidimicrobiales bacterium]|jgi:SAM-dependent methyltransferase